MTVKHLSGEGQLVTRDGRYRPGRYDVAASTNQEISPVVDGSFRFADGAERPGVDEDFFGPATLILSSGEEIDITLTGIHDHIVEIAGAGGPIRGKPGPHGGRP